MALWLAMVIALTCVGGLASPLHRPPCHALRELINELNNITNSQKLASCNGSMVWKLNWTTDMQYCAALESLTTVPHCSAILKTQKILRHLCSPKPMGSSLLTQDVKVEVSYFAKDLLGHAKRTFNSPFSCITKR